MANSLIIKELIDKLGISVRAFETEIKVGGSSIARAIERNSKIKDETVDKIIKAYPNVNREWLETGNGEMFIIDDTGRTSHRNTKKIPIVGEAAAGTDIEMKYTDLDNHYQDQYIDVGDLLRDSEAAFVVYGNSMTPAYPSGCILGIRRNYDGFIQPGETYLIVTKSNRVFKRLFYSDDKTRYVCYSDNTMMNETGPRKGFYAYPPFEVDIEKDVIQLYDVVGMIKRNRPTGIINRPK